ncbi:hypothetical protein BDC45DRAFT_510396 [Circinella umbellata]|nr:hypothetical protein BDC45DRAFT_510396 [Circinella umbellata]
MTRRTLVIKIRSFRLLNRSFLVNILQQLKTCHVVILFHLSKRRRRDNFGQYQFFTPL